MKFSYPSITDTEKPAVAENKENGEQDEAVVRDDYELDTVPLPVESDGDTVPDKQPGSGNGMEEDALEPKGAAAVVARAVSWILVPLFMPIYSMILINYLSLRGLGMPMSSGWVMVAVLAFINAVFPTVLIWLLKRLGIVHDMALNGRKERLYPYIITILAMFASAYYVHCCGVPRWICFFFLGGAASAAINMVVNLWWKISAHCAGIAGVIAMLLTMMRVGTSTTSIMPWLYGTIALAGILGTCRVYLRRHTTLQVIAGYTVGFTCIYLAGYL